MTSISRRMVLKTGALSLLAGCGTLTKATEDLDAYTLSPLAGRGDGRSSNKHLVVELPTSSGALATDRILIKPNPLQAEYLPEGRWVDATPLLLQGLLVSSLQNSGAFRLVGRDSAGLVPDYRLLVEVSAFQAEIVATDVPATPVRVVLTMTLVRDGDGTLIASRRFDQTSLAPNRDALGVVAAFDEATGKVLSDVVSWVSRLTR